MTSIVSEIIELLYSGTTGVATAFGQALTALVQAIFVSGSGTTESPYTLSIFGSVVVIFAAIALAIGLCRLVYNWVATLGAQH